MDSRGMYDSQVEKETSPDEFVLHPRLPSLQEMAYNQIAIAVWYRYNSTASRRDYELYDYADHWSTKKLELMDCHKLIKTLTMPRFMKENLKKYLKRVREEAIRCADYFTNYYLLSTYWDEYGIPQVDWEYFVWCPDGRINFKSTAIKMLHSGVLTEVQKFAIVSNFCLENEINSFDLNRRPMKTFIRKVNEDSDPLLFYWICYLKNELHTITPVSFLDSYDDDGYLMEAEAFEYFWNRLSAEDQISFISDRLRAFESYIWHDSLFYKMSHDQLTNLLFHLPVAVILFFVKEIEMLEWAILAWNRCKNRISNYEFTELLRSLLDKFEGKHIHHQEDKMGVLLEIWNTANDHQRNYAARQLRLEEAVCQPILSATGSPQFRSAADDQRFWKKLAPSSFKFLLKFLSLKSADFRKNLILRGNPSFIFYFDFHVVHEIFELCLPNSQGEVQFENEPSNYKIRPYFCIILYTVEDQDKLNKRLLRSIENLNIPSKDTVRKFIESLAIANRREHHTCNTYLSDLIRLSEFISKILQENMSTVLKTKEAYISSFSVTSDPYERYGSLYELSKLIEQEFVHEHLRELKHRLAEKLQKASFDEWVWMVSNYAQFTSAFSWCFENEEDIIFLQVKRCIPINNIISEVFDKIASENSTFDDLQRFLEWYFSGVEEEVISFKLGLINGRIKLPAKVLLKMLWEYGKPEKFLQWMGHPIDFDVKRRVIYGFVSFFGILFFAILSVIYVLRMLRLWLM